MEGSGPGPDPPVDPGSPQSGSPDAAPGALAPAEGAPSLQQSQEHAPEEQSLAEFAAIATMSQEKQVAMTTRALEVLQSLHLDEADEQGQRSVVASLLAAAQTIANQSTRGARSARAPESTPVAQVAPRAGPSGAGGGETGTRGEAAPAPEPVDPVLPRRA